MLSPSAREKPNCSALLRSRCVPRAFSLFIVLEGEVNLVVLEQVIVVLVKVTSGIATFVTQTLGRAGLSSASAVVFHAVVLCRVRLSTGAWYRDALFLQALDELRLRSIGYKPVGRAHCRQSFQSRAAFGHPAGCRYCCSGAPF